MVRKRVRKKFRLYGTKPALDTAWQKLFYFMDENNFSVRDFLACVCVNLLDYADKNYTTMLKVGGQDFIIQIDKYCGENVKVHGQTIKKVLKRQKNI